MATERSPADLDPDHARVTLDALDGDRGRLADRITTPGWYHPAVAALTAAAGVAPALPEPWTVTVLAVFVILLAALPALTRRGGIAMSVRPSGRATRLLLGLQVATLVVAMAASSAVAVLDLGRWWIAPIALAVFGVTVVLGGRYDRAQHAELSTPERPR